ncbi:NAD-P-binding protein [Lactarius indigo]|nr:NAD-P-binding protein [Lactarius indigo]
MAPMTTKVALVTGAARGIGRAIALRLADDGFHVAVNDLPGTPELDELIQEIGSNGRRSLGIPVDISLEPEVERMIQKVVQDLGSLDVMVANAGIIAYESFQNITVESCVDGFNRVMAVNVRGTMLCYKHAGKQMVAQGRGGRIIGASSSRGKQASMILPSYSATKFAIRVRRLGEPEDVAGLVSYLASDSANFITGT